MLYSSRYSNTALHDHTPPTRNHHLSRMKRY
ncbi:hypothetical protein SAMN05216276_105024 [Streptosporangium subroseum]|uniref:Uncharacterized protein n=1 Tax=Streptosporangium subroseum TaxID=106412 RepID=A0A239N2D1_9ACTN|nr:hypothetical protein SAMN05216276_105024 [Streptosporangium subroseum]